MHGGSLLDDLTSFYWRKSKTNKMRVMSIMARQNRPNNEGNKLLTFSIKCLNIFFKTTFNFHQSLFIQKTYWDNKSLINNSNFITGFFLQYVFFAIKVVVFRDHIMVHTRIWDGILFILAVVHKIKNSNLQTISRGY